MIDDKHVHLFAFDRPSTYSIWVEGHIEPGWSDRLEGMCVQPSIGEDGTSVTLLQGELPDQAALFGLLNTLYQMHLVVVMVLRDGKEAEKIQSPLMDHDS